MSTTQVTVHLRPDAAEELHGGGAPAASGPASEVVRAVSARGLALRPLTSGPANEALRSTFVIDATGEDEAAQLREELQGLAAVEAAYVKPEAQPP
jgi:hypothetical protein